MFVCVHECTCMKVQHACAVPVEVRRGIGSPGTGVTDSREHHVSVEAKARLLREQQVLLTTKPSLRFLNRLYSHKLGHCLMNTQRASLNYLSLQPYLTLTSM